MKKLIILFSILFSGIVLAQQGNPYVVTNGTGIVFKNESGTTVHAVSALGDTIVTQAFTAWDYDQITFSFVPGSGDTVHFNAFFQVGGGKLPTASAGIYDNGWKAMSAVQDSAAALGVRGAPATIVTFTPREIMGWQTTAGGYQASHDSTGTYYWGQGAVSSGGKNLGAQYVRFVIVGTGLGQDVSNTTLLDQCQVVQRRYEK